MPNRSAAVPTAQLAATLARHERCREGVVCACSHGLSEHSTTHIRRRCLQCDCDGFAFVDGAIAIMRAELARRATEEDA